MLPNQKTSMKDYAFLSMLGRGSFAAVYKARHMPTNKLCAVKAFDKQRLADPTELETFNNEISILRKADHPLIATCYDIFEDKERIYVSMELVENDTLLNYINNNGGLSETVARKIFSQIVLVLDYIHNTLHVTHRDLKAENILLDANYNIRVIDFGLSKKFSSGQEMLKTLCGSPAYAAPELIKGMPYNNSVDIWSIGVILYAMVAGYLPFDDDNYTIQLQRIVSADPEYPPQLSPILVDLLKKLLAKDPTKRITIEQLKTHPWVCTNILSAELDQDLFAVNFTRIDQDVVQKLKELNIDTTNLFEKLLNYELCRETASYKILRREITAKKLDEFFLLARSHRNSSIVNQSNRPVLPQIETPTKLAQSKLHPNTQSTPEHITICVPTSRMRTIIPNSPLLPPSPVRRRTRALSFMKNTKPIVDTSRNQKLSQII